MLSLWCADSVLPSFPKLNEDIKTTVAIIGGGIAGLLCANKLRQNGIDYVVLEADRICRGVTQNTTAKITSQHGFIYQKLVKSLGIEKALLFYKANEKAIDDYKRLSKNYPCEFEIKDNYVFSTGKRDIEKEIEALNRMGVTGDFIKEIAIPVESNGAVRFKNQAQFNPLQFLSGIARDLRIYENTKVMEIRDNKAITQNATITADYFIVATHFPFMNKHGGYFIKLYQERSYIIALENAQQVNGMYVDEETGGFSFRNYNEYLLLGGGDHRTGKDGGKYQKLRDFAKINYPDSREKYYWATQDCMSLDGIPYIGRYSDKLKNVFVVTGFNKWGMSSSMVAADILCDMIKEKSNEYSLLFSPSRNILKPQLIVNTFESFSGLVNFSTKRCPHLGCALKWNPTEHTWDCPCHGSRFTENGKLIENPATDDIKF